MVGGTGDSDGLPGNRSSSFDMHGEASPFVGALACGPPTAHTGRLCATPRPPPRAPARSRSSDYSGRLPPAERDRGSQKYQQKYLVGARA